MKYLYFLLLLISISLINAHETNMKIIGLLGGTSWPSTIEYYALLNTLVNERLGGYHNAKIILKSIDYNDIKCNSNSKDNNNIANILLKELIDLASFRPDCIIICCNSLHKYYDIIKDYLHIKIPVFHSVELVAQYAKKNSYNNVLLLATKSTLKDGFFAKILEDHNIKVMIPNIEIQDAMQEIISKELSHNIITEKSRNYFQSIISAYSDCDAVILGCSEIPLLINDNNSILPIINPIKLQCLTAVEFALN